MGIKNLKIGQKIFFGFGAVTLLMVSVLIYIFVNYTNQGTAIDLNLHTYNVISESKDILISLVDMETGARGYALAGKTEFLDPFDQGKDDFEKHYGIIKELTMDDARLQDRLIRLHNEYESWLKWETENVIEGRRKVLSGQSEMENLIATVQSGAGKANMDKIREILGEVIEQEQSLLKERSNNLYNMRLLTALIIFLGGFIAVVLAMLIAFLIIRMVTLPVKQVTNTFMEISQGDANLEVRLATDSKDELGDMARYFNTFICKLKVIITENKNQSWLKTGQAELNEKINGGQKVEELATNAITHVCKYVNAQIGALYIRSGEEDFQLLASYSYKRRKNLSNEVKLGEGIVGQAALEKQTIIITNVPEDYIKISSGVGEASPGNIMVTPCIHDNDVECVIEVGSFHTFTDLEVEFIENVGRSIAASVHTAEVRTKMQLLLDKTLQQAEELRKQQEELKQNNEELEEQAKALMESEANLEAQQEELRVANEELEEQTRTLEAQKNDLFTKNEHLRNAQKEIADKAKELEAASMYKSEFLANMSHELRTPLNSILVLSQMLANKKDTLPLTDKQLEYARTIHSSGEDLARLINDILDLSKVEAGKMDVVLEKMDLGELAQLMDRSFRPIAMQNGIDFSIHMDSSLPESIISDMQRVQQILNNLLSNAFKFTHEGGVTLDIRSKKSGMERYVLFSVMDTGIGIPVEKQQVIFDAFKQSDGTTSRKYGGTGLGLSISKELARLLGGRISVNSVERKGSTFSLALPENAEGQEAYLQAAATSEPDSEDIVKLTTTETERGLTVEMEEIEQGANKERKNRNEKILLIIEDDKNFSGILSDLAANKSFRCITTESGTVGISMALQYNPDAILLDIGLKDISGWKVIEQLRANRSTENIPVHVISGSENQNVQEKQDDIIGYLQKPVSLGKLDEVFNKIEGLMAKPVKKLLLLDRNKEQVEEVSRIIGGKDIQIHWLDSGREAVKVLQKEEFDCVILDVMLADMTGLELLSTLRKENIVHGPLIIHTDKILTQEEEAELNKHAESIIIKGSKSLERLVSEVSLFLHEVDSRMEEMKIKAIRSKQEKEESLAGKVILVVDDDMRNVFALSSIIEEKGMKVLVGRTGKEGIQKLQQTPNVDLILMDIMMPEMDGYMAMQEIRKMEEFRKVPIIALTAKAMKDDRQKCIEAGANDYLTKPMDVDKLISLMRVWLYK